MQMSSYWGSGTAVGKIISRPGRPRPRLVRAVGAGVTADLACREKWLAQAIFHGSTVKNGLELSRLYLSLYGDFSL